METDELTDDLNSLSFTSTTHNRSTSSYSSTSVTPVASRRSSFSLRIRQHLSFADLRFSVRLGSGDIGAVYLAELKKAEDGSQTAEHVFAAKVMDKQELVSRNKEGRATTEREILQQLDHPFLPTLFGIIESERWLCLLTEFCPGGDLHVLRQRQPNKRFEEAAVRFYASEILVALEYLHMMGIVYRDLKPENVLIRSDGHVMLTDFDLSLRCDDSMSTPHIISSYRKLPYSAIKNLNSDDPPLAKSSRVMPSCMGPAVSCFRPKFRRKKKKNHNRPQVVTEPMDARSMSFVGTHEYLAPEIVSGEGHGSSVDWWTLGIFMFELFYGFTPFRGVDNELTLANIVARALEFPKEPAVPSMAKDVISQLLIKDPARRMGTIMGASVIKGHPFFQGINWALLRGAKAPHVPPTFNRDTFLSNEKHLDTPVEFY